jgi:hypothetical protein
MTEIISSLVNSLGTFVSLFSNFKFSPEQLLVAYIAVLGILATIITLGSSLTKEWRQDLIIKYLIKKIFVLVYAGYLLISFIIFVLIYAINPACVVNIAFLLFIILFISTFTFLYQFIKSLDRKELYKEIYNKFEGELKNA